MYFLYLQSLELQASVIELLNTYGISAVSKKRWQLVYWFRKSREVCMVVTICEWRDYISDK